MTTVRKIGIDMLVDATSVKAGMASAGRDVDAFGGKVNRVGIQATRDFGLIERATQGVQNGVGLLTRSAGPLFAALSAREFIRTADSVTALHTSLSQSEASASQAAVAYSKLFTIAQQSRVSFTSLGGTYATISRAGQDLGVSQQRLLVVTQAIGNAMAIGGGSVQGMEAALVQLGQGLGSGVLRGEELNSVMEQSPRLARAMADGLGVPLGELRRLGAEGELTAEKVIGALEKAAPKLAEELASATLTVGQGFTMIANSATRLVGEVDKASRATGTTAVVMRGFAQDMDVVSEAVERARRSGGGFLSQFNDGLGALLGRALGLQLFSRDFMTAEQAIADASATIARLDAKAPEAKTSIYWMDERARAARDLARAQRELAQAGGVTGNATSDIASQFPSRGQSYANYEREQAKASQALLEVRQRLSGVNANYLKDLQQLQAALKAGSIGEAEYVELVSQLAKANFKKAESGRAAEKAMTEAAKAVAAYRNIVGDLAGKDSGLSSDFNEKAAALAKGFRAGADSADGYRAAVQKLIAQQPFAVKAATDAAAALQKTVADRVAARAAEDKGIKNWQEQQTAAYRSAVQGSEAALQAAQLEFDQYGKSRSQIAEITLATLQMTQAKLQDGSEGYAAIQRQIEAQRKLIDLLRRGEARDASAEAVQQAQQAWQAFNSDIERGLTDSLFRAFEAGADGGVDLFIKSVGNTLKTTTFKVGVQAVVGSITGAAGLSSSSVPGSVSGLANGLNSLSNFSTAGTVASIAGTLSNFTAGLSAGFSQFTAGVNTFASLANASAVGGSTGLGIGIGAAGPYVAAALALYAIAQVTKGETRGGGQYGYGATGAGNYGTAGATFIQGPSGGQIEATQVQAAINATVTGINATLAALGSRASLAGFQAALESSGNGRGGVYAGGTLSTGATFGEAGLGGGRSNYNGTLYESTSSNSPDAQAALAAFSTDLLQATIQALQAATDIPEGIAAMLRGVDAEALSAEAAATLIANVNAMAAFTKAAEALPFPNLRSLSFEAADALLKLTGGMEGLTGSLSAYYENFFTEAERQQQQVKSLQAVFGDLGLTMPSLTQSGEAARAQFRTLVEAQDLTTEAGRRNYAALLSVQGAFADLTPIGVAAAATINELTGQVTVLSDTMIELAREHVSLQEQYDQLALSEADYRAKMIAGYTAEEQAAARANFALQDRISALQREAAAAEEAARVTSDLVAQRAALEIELLRAQGREHEALAAQRALDIVGMTAAQVALYDYNQALRASVGATTAAADAARASEQAAQQAIAQAQARADAILQERSGLETQWLQLVGDTSALRERELAKLDASNRALQLLIWARQDEVAAGEEAARAAAAAAQAQQQAAQAAEQAAQRAAQAAQQAADQAAQQAEAVANEGLGLYKRLLTLQGDTNALRAMELAALDPANRALQSTIWLIEDQQAALSAAANAQAAYTSAIADASLFLAGTARTIADFFGKLRSTSAGLGSPSSQVVAARSQFDAQFALAQGGDRDALSGITGYADTYIQATRATASSALDVQRVIAQLEARLTALPSSVRPEQLIVQAIEQSTGATTANAAALNGAAIATAYAESQRGIAAARAEADRLIAAAQAQAAAITANATAQTSTTVTAIGASTSTTVNALAANFDRLDATADGLLSADELRAALGPLATDTVLRAVFATLDADGDGQISRLEAIRANTAGLAGGIAAALSGSFDRLDTSVNGLLDQGELRAALGPVATDSVLRQIFATLDVDGDGQISRLEAIRGSSAATAYETRQTSLNALSINANTQLAAGNTLLTADNVRSLAFNTLTFDAAAPLRSVFEATKLSAEASASIWMRITNGQLGAYVTLARDQNAEAAYGIGSNFMRAYTDWGGSGIKIESPHLPAINVNTANTVTQAQNTATQALATAQRVDLVRDRTSAAVDYLALINTSAVLSKNYLEGFFTGSPLRVYSFNREPAEGYTVFASGAAFMAPGVYSRPTTFGLGKLAEEGPEAIMPLANVGGKLGIRALMSHGGGSDNSQLIRGIAALATAIEDLKRIALAGTLATQDGTRLMDRLSRIGMPVRTLERQPLEVVS